MALTTVYQLKTFGDIIAAVMEELKYQSTDLVSKNRIKRDINMVYLNEVCPTEEWRWLRASTDLYLDAYLSSGTASVLNNSQAVTLSAIASPSRKGQWFASDGYGEVYRIKSHVAGTATVVLESPYTGPTNTTTSYRIWNDQLPLPVDCRETLTVGHNYNATPMEAVGIKVFRQHVSTNPRVESRPRYFTTGDYTDPAPYSVITGTGVGGVPVTMPATVSRSSSGYVRTITFASSLQFLLQVGDEIEITSSSQEIYNLEAIISSIDSAYTTITFTAPVNYEESIAGDVAITVKKKNPESVTESRRSLWVWPSVFNQRATLHVDYLRNAGPLVEDADEPLMPIHDRTVLLYGALQRGWSRERNPEEALRNFQLYDQKLKKMAGIFEDSIDYPSLMPSKTYLSTKRGQRGNRSNSDGLFAFGSTGSTSSATSTPVGVASRVAVYDGTGLLSYSVDVDSSELSRLDGILSKAVGESDAQILTFKTIDASLNTITEIANANIAAAANIARTKIASGTADHVVINSGTGALSSEATLAKVRGGSAQDNSSLTFPTSGTLSTNEGDNSIIAQQVFS